jgi:hypothetical protein
MNKIRFRYNNNFLKVKEFIDDVFWDNKKKYFQSKYLSKKLKLKDVDCGYSYAIMYEIDKIHPDYRDDSCLEFINYIAYTKTPPPYHLFLLFEKIIYNYLVNKDKIYVKLIETLSKLNFKFCCDDIFRKCYKINYPDCYYVNNLNNDSIMKIIIPNIKKTSNCEYIHNDCCNCGRECRKYSYFHNNYIVEEVVSDTYRNISSELDKHAGLNINNIFNIIKNYLDALKQINKWEIMFEEKHLNITITIYEYFNDTKQKIKQLVKKTNPNDNIIYKNINDIFDKAINNTKNLVKENKIKIVYKNEIDIIMSLPLPPELNLMIVDYFITK